MDQPEDKELLLADKAWLRLRELMTGDSLRAGQFLSMQDLVKLVGLPLAPTREAVKRAEAMSLVTILPKRGVLLLEATPELIRQCFDLRCIFDQEGARRLAAPQHAAQVARLRDSHRDVLERARAGVTPSLQSEAKKVDWDLHMALLNALDNPLIEEIYELNREKITIIQNSRPLFPVRIIPAMEEHLRIIDAIASGDPEAAAGSVREHAQRTLSWWGILN